MVLTYTYLKRCILHSAKWDLLAKIKCDLTLDEAQPERSSGVVKNENNEPLMVQESKEQGSVRWKTYQIYMKATGG